LSSTLTAYKTVTGNLSKNLVLQIGLNIQDKPIKARWNQVVASVLQKVAVALVILVLVSTLTVFQWVNSQAPMPIKQPPKIIFDDYFPDKLNVTQGATLQVNMTITSYIDTELSLPFENLAIKNYNNATWEPSKPQEKIFSYTFSQNPLILPPNGNNSCILTLQIANDAPIGEYEMYVKCGNATLTYVGGSNFKLTVTRSN
jgi:hypothetical protein